MSRQSRGFSFRLAVLFFTSLCLDAVTGYAWPLGSHKAEKRSMQLGAKIQKTQSIQKLVVEEPQPRATRTLYKPQPTDENFELEVLAIEKEIRESTKARLDLKRVEELLEEDTEAEEVAETADWQVSLAAGSVAAALTLGSTDSWTLATFALASVYFLANGDPVEEQTPAGAAARVVGRATMHAVNAWSPKVKSIARMAYRGEDQVALLTERIDALEAENANLRLWQKRRNAVDNAQSKYTLDQLKKKARKNKLPVGGSKTTLLMRLVEADVIDV